MGRGPLPWAAVFVRDDRMYFKWVYLLHSFWLRMKVYTLSVVRRIKSISQGEYWLYAGARFFAKRMGEK